MDLKLNHIYHGDALKILRGLPDASVDCVVTSPPYWSQRNYGTEPQTWGDGWVGELGMEPDFTDFVTHLLEVFKEVKRVMKPTGTVFVNLQDSYGGSGHNQSNDPTISGEMQGKNRSLSIADNASGKLQHTNWNKSLLAIPDRFKIGMLDLGFKCRNEIIWQKPNQTPQSATDRFTNDFEKVYFFTLSNKYAFNQQFEPTENDSETRNMRTVWAINTKPSGVEHFATFPDELPKRCIEAGCTEGGVVMDPFAGAGTTAAVAKQLGRNYVGIELNPDYAAIAEKRISENAHLEDAQTDPLKWLAELKKHVADNGHELTRFALAKDGKYYARICPRGLRRLAFQSCWHEVLDFGDLAQTKMKKAAKPFDEKDLVRVIYQSKK